MRIFLRIFLGLIIAASLFNCSSGGGGGGGGDEPTQVETPVIDPAGGTVERYVDDVTITCATSGATIYYTDNGDDPTTDSLVYTDPIVLDTVGGITIKAFAAKSGSDDSGTAVADFTVEDTVGPSGTLTSAKATWYVDDILFTVTFNEPVTDFDDLADILVDSTNATVISIDGTLNPVFVVTVNPDDTETEADITISVPADVCTDDYAQSNTAVSSHTVHFNPDAVIAEITSSESSPTNTDPIPITITFNNDVENFDENDLVIGNGAVEGGSFAAVSASEYTANIVPSVTDDDVTVDIPEGVCNQLSGVTPNIASEQFSIRFDSEQPGVEITSTETDPSNADPIPLTITFTEAVGNFAVGDLDVVNGTAGDFTGTGDSYTVNITPDADGTVTVDIAEGTCNDAAGNLNTAATQFSIYSKTSQPSVLLETAESSPTNADTFSVTITFSEEVDFVEGDLTLGNCTSGNFDDTNNPVFTVDISPTADGTVTVDVAADVCADNYGNGNTAATQLSLTSDRTGPVATMDSVTGDPTNASSFTVTIDFDESTADFAADDITVSNGTKGTFGGTGTAYSIEITPDAAGLVTVDISVGVCTDALGNLNPAATQFARTVDWTAPDPPTVEQASGQNDPALVQPVLFTATFSEPVNFEAADVDLSGGTATGGTVTVTEITETTYEISVDGLTSAGDVVASIPVDAVQDLAGNNCPASTSTDNTVTFTGIIKGNTGSNRTNNGTSLSISNFNAGSGLSNPVLIVYATARRSNAITWNSATFGASSMTALTACDASNTFSSNEYTSRIYYLTGATGTGNITVAIDGSNASIEMTAILLYNVDQTTPFGATAAVNDGSSTTIETEITTGQNGSWLFDGMTGSSGYTEEPVPGTGQTSDEVQSQAGWFIIESAKPVVTAGLTSMSWEIDTSQVGILHSVAEVKMAP